MATKSILKNVNIKTKKEALALINALENADKKGEIDVNMSRRVSKATVEELKKMFGVEDDGI